jgi:lambda repressor-like predicted transcriptional regulator
MSAATSRWDLSEVEISASANTAALGVVRRLTREKDEITSQWGTAMLLAQANGASLREIADAAGVAPQTVSNLLRRKGGGRASVRDTVKVAPATRATR